MTVWIGLTGAIGSGKSQVAACFSELDIPIIDADAIAKMLTSCPHSPALQQIQKVFGQEALDISGSLNRQFMRERIFSDKSAKTALEQILHPLILQEIEQQKQQYPHAIYGIIEIPTLTENPDFQKIVSHILVVICNPGERIQRVMQRSGLTEEAVQAIMRGQASDAQRAQLADDFICNEGSLNYLRERVNVLHQEYCTRFGQLKT